MTGPQSDDSDTATVSPNLFKQRTAKNSFRRKRAAASPEASDASSASASDASDDEGRTVKRRRKAPGVVARAGKSADTNARKDDQFTADRSRRIDEASDATRRSNWFNTDQAKSQPAMTQLAASTPDDTYRGAAQYQSYVRKNPNAPTRGPVGPVKAPANVRTVTVTDYAPDVCKDYKLTGFCGFGDSCKFLHAREDYKQGWQLDHEWEKVTKNGTNGSDRRAGNILSSTTNGAASSRKAGDDANADEGDNDDDDEAALEGIPFACIICQQSYRNPIRTRCGHYFCEACALRRFKKTPSCVACGAGTGGVFNGARDLRKLLDRKRARMQARGEVESEEDQDAEDDEAGANETSSPGSKMAQSSKPLTASA